MREKLVKSDVVPLIKEAFAESFGNVQSSLKALRQRGFNLLNRALECDPELSAKEKVVRAVEDRLEEINTDEGAAGAKFDFMAHVLSNEGRRRRVEEQVQQGQKVLEGSKRLRFLTA
jgi:hypothetical protein